MNADGRRGRAFSIRVEEEEETELRNTLATLQLLPYDQKPQELFGWNGGRRRSGSFGAFIVWAARQYKAPPQAEPEAIAPVTPRRRRRGHTAPSRARSHRPRGAGKTKAKKGGRK